MHHSGVSRRAPALPSICKGEMVPPTDEPQEDKGIPTDVLRVLVDGHMPLFKKPGPWEYWRGIGAPTTVLAPMVAGSDLPFRALVRGYGVEYAYTPMVNTHTFLAGEKARRQMLRIHPDITQDTPLAVQFATHSAEELVQSIQLLPKEGVACVDINLGCPQRIAQRGHYGAYLLDDVSLIQKLVRAVYETTPFVVTAKIRALDTHEKTLSLCRVLVDAGCAVIAVHGRSRDVRQASGTPVDLELLKMLSDMLSVPIIANGGVDSLEMHKLVLERTGCAATMAGMGLLRFPFMYSEPLPADKVDATNAPEERLIMLTTYLALLRQAVNEYAQLVEQLITMEGQRISLLTSHIFKMLAFLWGPGISDTTAHQVAAIRDKLMNAIRTRGGELEKVMDEYIQLAFTLPDDDITILLKHTRLVRTVEMSEDNEDSESCTNAPASKRDPKERNK